jgi:hypothetical protein
MIFIEDNQENIEKSEHKPPKMQQCNICGSTVWKTNMKRHVRSKKHKDAYYVVCEKFEFK